MIAGDKIYKSDG